MAPTTLFPEYIGNSFNFTLAALIAYFLLVNALTFRAISTNKKQAQAQQGLSDTYLLALAAAGGSIGAKLAQRRFQHKTSKKRFKVSLNFIIALQIGMLLLQTDPVQSGIVQIGESFKTLVSNQL